MGVQLKVTTSFLFFFFLCISFCFPFHDSFFKSFSFFLLFLSLSPFKMFSILLHLLPRVKNGSYLDLMRLRNVRVGGLNATPSYLTSHCKPIFLAPVKWWRKIARTPNLSAHPSKRVHPWQRSTRFHAPDPNRNNRHRPILSIGGKTGTRGDGWAQLSNALPRRPVTSRLRERGRG